MRKVSSAFFGVLIATSTVSAAIRSESEARQCAARVLKQSVSVQLADVETFGNDTLYYIFKGQASGYAIVSANDQQQAVLAFDQDEEYQSKTSMPFPLQFLLQTYCKNVELKNAEVNRLDSRRELKASRIIGIEIEPLLGNIKWGQRAPYNSKCPLSKGERSVTGCVATAVAQVMKYYNYPRKTIKVIPSYTTQSESINVSFLGSGEIFEWEKIVDNYPKNGYTTAQADAVAKLMQYVGAAYKMDYTQKQSSASLGPEPLVNYFGYDADLIRYYYRTLMTIGEWNDMIVRELKAKRPVCMRGSSSGGGHAFVIDGVNKEGLFHVNWGWNGSYDGYYDMTLLCPENNDGEGASTTSDGYTGSNAAIVGLQPDNGISDPVSASPLNGKVVLTFCGYSYASNVKKSYITLVNYIASLDDAKDITVAGGYVADNGEIVPVTAFLPLNVESGTIAEIDMTKLKKGNTYKIVQLESADGGATYHVSPGSSLNYLELTYNEEGLKTNARGTELSGEVAFSNYKKSMKEVKGNISLKNAGDQEYYNSIYIYTSNTNTMPSQYAFKTTATIEPGEDSKIPFAVPSLSGDTLYYWMTGYSKAAIAKGFILKDTMEYVLSANVSFDFFSNFNDNLRIKVDLRNKGNFVYNDEIRIYCSDTKNLTAIIDNPAKVFNVKIDPNGKKEVSLDYTDSENNLIYYWITDVDNNVIAQGNRERTIYNYDIDASLSFSGFESIGDEISVIANIHNNGSWPFFSLFFAVNNIDSFPEYIEEKGFEVYPFYDEDVCVDQDDDKQLQFTFKAETDSIHWYLADDYNSIFAKGLLVAGKDYVELVASDDQPMLWISTERGLLTVEAMTDTPVYVASANGRILYMNKMKVGEVFMRHLNPGIYIVNGKKVTVE